MFTALCMLVDMLFEIPFRDLIKLFKWTLTRYRWRARKFTVGQEKTIFFLCYSFKVN
jgi:hypothetical protein